MESLNDLRNRRDKARYEAYSNGYYVAELLVSDKPLDKALLDIAAKKFKELNLSYLKLQDEYMKRLADGS